MIDFTKPVQTRSGYAVRILCTDCPGGLPIAGIVETKGLCTWRANGRYYTDFESELDLQNVPEKPPVYTVLVFTNVHSSRPKHPAAFVFTSEAEAQKFRTAESRRHWSLVRAIEDVTQWSLG